MTSDRFFYLVPYFLSLSISLGILTYSWRHRKVKGAGAYTWYMAGQFLSVIAFIFEILSPRLETKLFWDKFQWLTDGMLIILAFLLFAIQFTDHKVYRSKLFWLVMLAIPIFFNLLVATDSAHHLIYPNPHLDNAYPYAELRYDFTTAVYLFALYIYLAPLYGMSILINYALRVNRVYRWQAITIAIGFFIPLAFSILALLGIEITQQRDATPFTFAIGNLIVVWGLFRYGTFEIIPVARERVIENMNDPVIVLAKNNRIIDINSSGLRFIGSNLADVIGLPTDQAFKQWPDLVELLEQPDELRQELTIQTEDDAIFLEINISKILNNNLEVVSRVLILHDITRLKTLEVSYRILSSELDQRVKDRTRELQESEARYRVLFEDSPIQLFEEDFSKLKIYIDQLRETGVTDFKTYFENRPDELQKCTALVQITDINKAALTWYSSLEKLDVQKMNLGQLINTEANTNFINELIFLINGHTHYQFTISSIAMDGKPIHMILNGNVAPGYEHTWERVLVSIQDITPLKLAEQELAVAYDTTLEGWARALELRDKETEGHSRRVTEKTLVLAKACNISEDSLVDIRRGAILHDIGKMAIPDEILRKNGALTSEERRIVERHPQVAYNLLKDVPHLKNAIEIPYCHHEKWDGSGYPRGLKGTEIPLTARIFAIVDVWDALSSDRPYRNAWDKDKVIEYLKSESDKHFDPHMVNIFLGMVEKGEI